MFENLLFGTSNMCIIVSYAIMLLRAIIEYEFEFEEARVRLWTDISALAGKLNAQSSYRSLFRINSIGQLMLNVALIPFQPQVLLSVMPQKLHGSNTSTLSETTKLDNVSHFQTQCF